MLKSKCVHVEAMVLKIVYGITALKNDISDIIFGPAQAPK